MNWMRRWPGGFPVFVAEASGAHFVDVDGIEYVDFCLGDTGAMSGHRTFESLGDLRPARQGLTTMLPTEDAIWVGEELRRRFRMPWWQLAISATDANRFVIRLARFATGRPRILVFNGCYHGTVDETLHELEGDAVVPRPGNAGPPIDPALTTRIVEFNDAAALERELAHGDVALVLAEPALTNVGIVLPVPGYHDSLREITRAAARSSRSTRRTRSASGPVARRRRGTSIPMSSSSANRSVVVSRSRRTDSVTASRGTSKPRSKARTAMSAASAGRSRAPRSRSRRSGDTLSQRFTPADFDHMIPLRGVVDRRGHDRDE